MTYSAISLKLFTPLIPGSPFVAIASIIHSILGRPIVFVNAKPLNNAIVDIYSWLIAIPSKYIDFTIIMSIALTAFLFRFDAEFVCRSMVIGGIPLNI